MTMEIRDTPSVEEMNESCSSEPPHMGPSQEHLDEVVKFIQYGQRKVHLTIREEGDTGEEYLSVEMRRNNGKMRDATSMNDTVICALATLIADGQMSAMVINRTDYKTEGN